MSERNHLQHHYSTTKNSKPNTNDLLLGEIAINATAGNEKLFIKNSAGELIELSLASTTTPETTTTTTTTPERLGTTTPETTPFNVEISFSNNGDTDFLNDSILRIISADGNNIIYSVTISEKNIYIPCYVKPFIYENCLLQIVKDNAILKSERITRGNTYDFTYYKLVFNGTFKTIQVLIDGIVLSDNYIKNTNTGVELKTDSEGQTIEKMYIDVNHILYCDKNIASSYCYQYQVLYTDVMDSSSILSISLNSITNTTPPYNPDIFATTTTVENAATTTTTTTTVENAATTTTTTVENAATTTTTTTTVENATTTSTSIEMTNTNSEQLSAFSLDDGETNSLDTVLDEYLS